MRSLLPQGPTPALSAPITSSRPLPFTSPYSPHLPIFLQPPISIMLSWMKTVLGLAAYKTSGGKQEGGRVRLVPRGDLRAGQPTLLSTAFHSCLLSPFTPQGPARGRTGRVLHEEICQVVCGRDVRAQGGSRWSLFQKGQGSDRASPPFPTAILFPGCMEDLMSSRMTSPSNSCSQESSKGGWRGRAELGESCIGVICVRRHRVVDGGD